MNRADQFREKAEQCARLAETARDPKVRAQYEALARQWRELAENADKRVEPDAEKPDAE